MYKLITKHKDYLLLVDSESHIFAREWFVNNQNELFQCVSRNLGDVLTIHPKWGGIAYSGDCSKVIAHLPLNSAPVLEGILLLPDLPKQEEKIEYEITAEEYLKQNNIK